MAARYCDVARPDQDHSVTGFESEEKEGCKSETAILIRIMDNNISENEISITNIRKPTFIFNKKIIIQNKEDDHDNDYNDDDGKAEEKEKIIKYGIISFGDTGVQYYNEICRTRPSLLKKYILFKTFKPYLYDF